MTPALIMLTDRHQVPAGRSLPQQVARAVDGGVRAVILRERDLADRVRADLASALSAVLTDVGGRLVLAAPATSAELPYAVHLRADDPFPSPRPPVVGRSCHSAAELVRAYREGADFVLLGPVAASASKPGYGPALGASGLARLSASLGDASAGRPRVYALGGVDPGNAARWLSAGADGVAVMGALMRADDPASVAADLVATLPPTSCADPLSTELTTRSGP